MSQVSEYSYLHARVSVMASRLLADDMLRQLIDQPLEQSMSILEKAGLSGLDINQDTRSDELEQLIVTILMREAVLLARPLSGIARDLLYHWVRRFEIINIKRMIRNRIAGSSREQAMEGLLHLTPFQSLSVEELVHTEDVNELLRMLEQTPYADMARLARSLYEEKHELFSLEAAFDRQYFTGLIKRVNAHQHADQIQLRTIIGPMMDQVNLVWLLRYRFVFHLAPSYTYLLLVPGGRYLGNTQLLELVQQDSMQQVLEKLPEQLSSLVNQVKNITDIEILLEQHLVNIAYSILDRTAFNLGRVFAYLILREKQLLQIHIALKGKHLRLENSLIHEASGWQRVSDYAASA